MTEETAEGAVSRPALPSPDSPAESPATSAAGITRHTPLDPGMDALALLFACHGWDIPAATLRREEGLTRECADAALLVRCARRHGMKATLARVSGGWLSRRLERQPLPAIAEMRGGGFVLLAKIGPDEVLVHDPLRHQPIALPRRAFTDAWSGRLILARPMQESGRAAASPTPQPVAGRSRFGFSWFWPLLRPHKALLLQIFLASLLLQVFGLFTPLFTTVIMDKILVTGGLTTLDIMGIGLLAVSVFEFFMSAARSTLFAHTTSRLDAALSGTLFRHLTALPVSWFDQRRTGAVTARVQDLEAIRGFLTGSALTAVIDLVFAFVYLAVMAVYSPLLTAVVVAIMLAVALVYGVITPRLRTRLSQRDQSGADSQSFLIETIGGINTVKGLSLESALQRRWENFAAGQANVSRSSERLAQVSNSAVTLLNRLMVVVTLWWGAHLVIAGTLTAGQLMGFNMMAGRVMGPAQRLAQLWQQFQQARLAVQRVGEILDTPPEPLRSTATALPALRGRVEVRDLTFRYRPDAAPVLQDISFTVEPGSVVAVIGASGSGKSTLVRLLQRLYLPDSGQILMDGADIAGLDPRWLRRQVALVPQDTFLFDGTVRENIALAEPLLSVEEAAALARVAEAHGFIMELPEAYDTRVGERGHRLSGGQRQRIALARALALNPRILVLDEATSALDAETEQRVQANIRHVTKGRTVFIVAHRLSSWRLANRVLVLEHGRLVESGTPSELVAADGTFARMVRQQNTAARA